MMSIEVINGKMYVEVNDAFRKLMTAGECSRVGLIKVCEWYGDNDGENMSSDVFFELCLKGVKELENELGGGGR